MRELQSESPDVSGKSILFAKEVDDKFLRSEQEACVFGRSLRRRGEESRNEPLCCLHIKLHTNRFSINKSPYTLKVWKRIYSMRYKMLRFDHKN